MAVTGQFLADFTTFSTGVTQALTSLKSFETGSEKVERQLNRMGDSFSGKKVIQDATLAAKAIQDIGGTATLTDREMARLSATAAEAVDKMKRLGLDVPKGLKDIANETRGASGEQNVMVDTLNRLGPAMVAAFAVREVVAFGKEMLTTASNLADLSQQTHIGVEDLQLLGGAMSEFGVDADALGKGIFTLSRKVAGEDDSAAAALHTMGMTLKDLQGLNGRDLFLKIEDGLAQLQGGLRDDTAAALFGSKLGAAMAGASEGIRGTLQAWQDHNKVVNKETNAALDALGETYARVTAGMKAAVANGIGPYAEGVNHLGTLLQNGVSDWDAFIAAMKDTADATFKTGSGTEHLTKLMDDANVKALAAAEAERGHAESLAGTTTALEGKSKALTFLQALEADAGGALTEQQRAELGRLKEIGQLNAQNAKGIGVSAGAFARYTVEVKAADEAEKQLAADRAKYGALYDAGLAQATIMTAQFNELRVSSGGTANEQEIARIKAWGEEVTARMHKAGSDTAEFYAARNQLSDEMLARVGVDWAYINSHSQEALEEQARNYRNTLDEMLTGSKTFNREALDEMTEKTEKAEAVARGLGDTYVSTFKRGRDGVKGMKTELESMQAALQLSVQTLIALGHQITNADGSTGSDADGYTFDDPKAKSRAAAKAAAEKKAADAAEAAAAKRERDRQAAADRVAQQLGGPLAGGGPGATLNPGAAGGTSGVVSVSNTFNVVDTEANIARRVSAQIMRSVLAGQKLAAA